MVLNCDNCNDAPDQNEADDLNIVVVLDAKAKAFKGIYKQKIFDLNEKAYDDSKVIREWAAYRYHKEANGPRPYEDEAEKVWDWERYRKRLRAVTPELDSGPDAYPHIDEIFLLDWAEDQDYDDWLFPANYEWSSGDALEWNPIPQLMRLTKDDYEDIFRTNFETGNCQGIHNGQSFDLQTNIITDGIENVLNEWIAYRFHVEAQGPATYEVDGSWEWLAYVKRFHAFVRRMENELPDVSMSIDAKCKACECLLRSWLHSTSKQGWLFSRETVLNRTCEN